MRLFTLCAALLLEAGGMRAAVTFAQSTTSPDRRTYLINRTRGEEQWTIAFLNASSLSFYRDIGSGQYQYSGPEKLRPQIVGNVFRTDGTAISFVVCEVDAIFSTRSGPLALEDSEVSLSCSVAGPCVGDDQRGTARRCATRDWSGPIFVGIEGEFLLPQAGTLRPPTNLVAAPRGSTLAPDGLTFLVTKDLGSDRWSILLPLYPEDRGIDPTGELRLGAVIGNIFKSDGTAPSFIFCTENAQSSGNLGNPESEFRLACKVSGPCGLDVDSCSSLWTDVPGASDVAIKASFFLPAAGFEEDGALSDLGIFVIGRTSDPSSIASSADTASSATVSGGCPVGSPCSVERLGACDSPAASFQRTQDGRCVCLFSFADAFARGCISPGSPAVATPQGVDEGGICGFPFGRRTARGRLLRTKLNEGVRLACYPQSLGTAAQDFPRRCFEDADCGFGPLCLSDPRYSCSARRCPGICVSDPIAGPPFIAVRTDGPGLPLP